MAEAALIDPSGQAAPLAAVTVIHPRKRSRSASIDRAKIAERIKEFFDTDNQERAIEIDARLQRYAKFRMWSEPNDLMWEGSTNFANPDMMTASMRLQDTLHNAVLSQRPPVMAKATKKPDKDKEEKINSLLDYQFFEEQPGEQIVGTLADDFVNEGLYTAYIPWIDESRTVREIKVYPMVPVNVNPVEYFANILAGMFPKAGLQPSMDGWDWKIELDGKRYKANFYTNEQDQVEMEVEHDAQVYNGPRVIRKDIQDVLHPPRCENLQIKSPSNPLGASHVILKDYPSIDEIQRLYEDGFYDLMTKEEAEKLGILRMDTSYQELEQQKDIMQGHVEQKDVPKGAESHKPLTRLMCFDSYDINGDGLDEDVIFWMILEEKIVLRAKYLTQMFPSNPPRRPFAEAQLFPVPGRRYAIGMLEMMEGVHDLMKQFFDQGGDAGMLANLPFGFYRPFSSMQPTVLRPLPGDLYPLSNPKDDVNFPVMGNQQQTFAFNMIALLQAVEERLTTIGDLQVGRVPRGKASALRTVAGMQTILAQGDARPERVLRRFFMGLTQIWQQMHSLNKTFLPKNKQYMICGYSEPDKDPYGKIGSVAEIQGDYRYTFSANVLNTSKEATQQALQSMMAAYVNPLALQLGIIDGGGIFRLERDYGRSLGQDPDKYLKPPMPDAYEPPIFAEEAIDAILSGNIPQGPPAEGFDEHLAKLQEFANGEDNMTVTAPDGTQVKVPSFHVMPPELIPTFRQYLERTAALAAQERQRQAMMAAAAQFSGQTQPDGMPGPMGQPQVRDSTAPLNPGELTDETLPGAGGGGNQTGMM